MALLVSYLKTSGASHNMIRVGRCFYDKGVRVDPHYPGFTTIVVLTKGTNRWGMLGPYELKDEEGHIMENVWQFSKVYPQVEATRQKKSRFEPNTIVWDHPSETHLLDAREPASVANCTPAYWAWRRKGFEAPYAVRYPPGFGKMSGCVGSLVEVGPGEYEGPLNYVQSRKALYVPLYARLARQSPLFAESRRRYERGHKLLIAEVDGPHRESLSHYVASYGVSENFIEHHSVLASLETLKVLLDDGLHPFGHGYCLAAAVLDIVDALLTDEPSVDVEVVPETPAPPICDDDPLWAELGLM